MRNQLNSGQQVVVIGLALVALGGIGAYLGLRPAGVGPVSADAGGPAPAAGAKAALHELHPLSGWDGPFAFDPLAYLSEATTAARKKHEDAVLVSLKLSRVTPAGRVNLKLKDAYAAYRFRSPSRSKAGATPGAEACLVDVVVTGESVQVLTPAVPPLGCSSPAVFLPECDLLGLWLVTLQEQTPTEALGSWELTPPPGVEADSPTVPAGQWKLTMPTAAGPFERSFDAACKPIGREKPVAPVDPARWRAENSQARAPRAPTDPNSPAVVVRPVRFKGPLRARLLQDVYEANSTAFADCYKSTNSQCNGCLPAASASVDLVIGADGNAAVTTSSSGTPQADVSDPQSVAQASDRFEKCVRSVMLKVRFPALSEPTETTHRVVVMPPPSQGPKGDPE